jgi:predicted  nucleic acid-binding Zn-ribbon protein
LTLLEVQSKDSTLAQLEHRRKSLPEHARIAALTAEANELSGQHVEAETEVGDLERAQKKFDAEVELVRQRRVRDEDRMSSGAITNPKDLASMQHELGALDRRISTLEDEELEIMEQLEEAQARLMNVGKDVERVHSDLERETAARDSALADIESEIATVTIARDGLASGLPADLIALYDKVRGQHSGLGAAALRARRCEGCRLVINGADLRELASKAEDEIVRCPECSRILVRTAESGL